MEMNGVVSSHIIWFVILYWVCFDEDYMCSERIGQNTHAHTLYTKYYTEDDIDGIWIAD